jgi:hypothetical protein
MSGVNSDSNNNEEDLKLVERTKYLIFYYFSTVVFARITYPNGPSVELTLLLISLFIIWKVGSKWFKLFVYKMWFVTNNPKWMGVLDGIVEYITTVVIFLVFQCAFALLSQSWQESNFNIVEIIAVVFVSIIGIIGICNTVAVLFNWKTTS